jgi:hypothetical protein
LFGAIEYEQVGAAASWLTVKGCPAMLRLPLRAPPLLAATLNVTVPGPLPPAADVNDIHDAWLDAVHPHPGDVEMLIVVPAPPAAPMD